MLLGLLLAGISSLFKDPTAGDYSYPEGTADPHNPFENLMYRITGQGLTGQQVASNNFAHNEAELAFNRSLMADSTKYQRSVADMQSAGINPMLAAGGVGGSSVSAPAATPSADAGANLGSILSFIVGLRNASIQKKLGEKSLDIQGGVAASEIAKNQALANEASTNAAKVAEDTRGAKLQNDYFERMQGVREEAERLANDLTASRRREIYKNIDKMDSEITKNIEEAHSEQAKQSLYISRELLNNVTADNIIKMRPYLQEELKARSEAERNRAKVDAVDEAYRQKMIDEGAIEAAIRETGSKASVQEFEAKLKEYELGRKTGNLDKLLDKESMDIAEALYSGLYNLSSSLLGK